MTIPKGQVNSNRDDEFLLHSDQLSTITIDWGFYDDSSDRPMKIKQGRQCTIGDKSSGTARSEISHQVPRENPNRDDERIPFTFGQTSDCIHRMKVIQYGSVVDVPANE